MSQNSQNSDGISVYFSEISLIRSVFKSELLRANHAFEPVRLKCI